MPARPRCLTHRGIPRVPPVFSLAAAVGALVMVSGCAGVPSSPSRTPPPSSTPTAVTTVTPSPTPQLVGTTRTVLSPLGLRIHSAPVLDIGLVPEEYREEFQRQSATDVTVRSVITSMRLVSMINWAEFFESVNHVDRDLPIDTI